MSTKEITLLTPEEQPMSYQKAKEHVKSILQNYHCEIFNESDYGIHKLSYPIRKVNEGKFYFYHFKCDGKSLQTIEKELRYELSILRFIIVRLDEIMQKKEVKKEESNSQEA